MSGVRRMSARLVARRVAALRKPRRKYELRNRPAHWLTTEQVFAAADEALQRDEAPTNSAVCRILGITRTSNTVRLLMRGYWRDIYERLQSAALVRKRT